MSNEDVAAAGIGTVLWLMIAAVGFCAYWVPTIIGFARKHHQRIPIALVNFFFGWTFLGWVGALIWAVSAKRS